MAKLWAVSLFSSVSHLEGNNRRPHVAVRRVETASIADTVLRALRPAGDDKEQDLSFLGPQKTPQSFAPEQIQRVRRPLWRRESPGSKSAALTSRQPLMPDLSSLLGIFGGAVLAVYLVRYYREHYTRSGWLRSGQEASHRLHRA